MVAQTVELPYRYTPHPLQAQYHASAARIRVLACGARWGKDRASINDLISRLVRIYNARGAESSLIPFAHAWIVAPNYSLARQDWRELQAFTPRAFGAVYNQSLLTATWHWPKGDVLIEIKSADDPRKLVSVGLDYLLMTEAGLVAEEAWQSSLRPRLASPGRAGLATINGTPRGRNWFYALYLRGQDEAEPDYASWNYPSDTNPHLDPAEFERARREMPDRWFRQEMLAEFLQDQGGVFRRVRERVTDRPAAGPVTVGVDWGITNDFTVLTAIQSGHVVGFDRMNEVSWELQRGRLKAFCDVFKPALVMPESNSMGGPLIELLQIEMPDYPIQPFTTTAQSKRQLIDHLALGIEQGRVSYPDIPQLVNELEAYEYSVTAAGTVRMNAPSGYHDDCVMSLALAYWAQEHRGLDPQIVAFG